MPPQLTCNLIPSKVRLYALSHNIFKLGSKCGNGGGSGPEIIIIFQFFKLSNVIGISIFNGYSTKYDAKCLKNSYKHKL